MIVFCNGSPSPVASKRAKKCSHIALTRSGIMSRASREPPSLFGAINSADTLALIFVVVVDVVLLDVRRSEIAILDALHVRIFIRRFAKVIVVIGQLTLVLLDDLLGLHCGYSQESGAIRPKQNGGIHQSR